MRGWKKRAAEGFLFKVISAYYLLLRKTCRFQYLGFEGPQRLLDAKAPFVFAAAHCSLLPCVLSFDGRSALFLTSRSSDGTLIAKLLRLRGFQVIQGSSSRGGAAALFSLRKAMSSGVALALTFDGPRGPPCIPKPGVVDLALSPLSQGAFFAWIEMVGLRGKLHIKLRSWDRFVLPLPFCSFKVHFEAAPEPLEKHSFSAWLEARCKEVYKNHYSA